MTTRFSSNYLRRHIALPGEHGAWVFILSPLLIGLFAGGRWTAASAYLVVAAMAAFLIRQPVSVAIKVFSGRRSRRDLPAAYFWTAIYGLVAALALAGLIARGFAYVLVLALPGVPVFAWHLYLVSRRLERRQVGVEVVGSGVLALAATAAFWVGIGEPDPIGWWLFVLTWLQSAASIVYAYLRLEQREMASVPELPVRWRMGQRALLYTTFNLLLSVVVALLTRLPALLPLPYALQWLETLWGLFNPAVGIKPTRIGLRQLAVSSLFTLLFILAWLI
ncbi:MAG TPA: YwiC-like family protein [Anaerolineales bacterium]|nr:YwiC-like family protein [Anaerolineales bacterium]